MKSHAPCLEIVVCSFLALVCRSAFAVPLHSVVQQNASIVSPVQPLGKLLADAIIAGNTAAAKVLLKRGVSPNAPVTRSDLSYAVSTPLIYAVTYRKPAIVNLLLDKGANINGLDKDPNDLEDAPLAYAASGEDIPMSRLLLKRGADINGGSSKKFTPLMAALFGHYPDMVQFLIRHGANVNRADAKGFTPLMLSRSQPNMVWLLLTHGAKVNAKTHDNTTALMMAAKSNGTPGGTAVIRVLLAHGANPALQDAKGRTALMMASDPAVRSALLGVPNHS